MGSKTSVDSARPENCLGNRGTPRRVGQCPVSTTSTDHRSRVGCTARTSEVCIKPDVCSPQIKLCYEQSAPRQFVTDAKMQPNTTAKYEPLPSIPETVYFRLCHDLSSNRLLPSITVDFYHRHYIRNNTDSLLRQTRHSRQTDAMCRFHSRRPVSRFLRFLTDHRSRVGCTARISDARHVRFFTVYPG